MDRCSAITRRGDRCKQTVLGPDGLCWAHSPENARRRSESAARAGSARGGPAFDSQAAPALAARYREQLERIADGVLDPESGFGSKSAAVAVTALNACLRALTVEADLRERGELETRLRRIEESRWSG